MPTSWRRGAHDSVGYVVVERDGIKHERRLGSEEPTATVNRLLRRSRARRQEPIPTDTNDESEDDYEYDESAAPAITPMTTPSLAVPSGPPTLLFTMTVGDSDSTPGALAANDPGETVVVAIPPPQPHHDGGGGGGHISQTTEHLLIAAGSIGATIIIVMIVLAAYTMRKRGLTFKDVIQQGKQQFRRGPPPPSASRYELDKKQMFDDERAYGMNDTVNAPRPAAIPVRSGSLSTQKPLQALERSDSFNKPPTRDGNQSFYDDAPSRSNSHRRNESATPSSPLLPIEGQRQSASTRNTRSMDGSEATLQFPEAPQRPPSNLPAPPTFRQFLSNRPSISQRPGFGGAAAAPGGMASRFSWTNSNAPQTPHDPSRDTVTQPVGRESFMTSRSSVPRFRTVDSWVNQQSNRVEEQRLKQQFRMTQSTTYSEDEVPEIPALPSSVPKNASGITRQPSAGGMTRNGSKSGLVGRDIKHQRHDTATTAPIFKAHPGTEVRFSTRSAVPSEILDMGRQNAAL
ncbi:hypothetical protein DDE82_007175 [Stemphylium lycopersici]|uniref:Uncharacterized protein n=1 Tax=Stemphylium lycopersici TaxID=183478 RepID=A0A364N0D3_STELY|nr:hypothetical protein DDE82_007175 [Stemphylium lycopersici]RAR08676.1 hypothetical protein DDE83_005880 [Stemphylium lycopersici]